MNNLRKYIGLKLAHWGKFVFPYGAMTAQRTTDGEDGAAFIDSDLNALRLHLGGTYKQQASLVYNPAAIVSDTNETVPGMLRAVDTSGGPIVVDLDPTLPAGSMVGYIDVTGTWATNKFSLRAAANIQGEAVKEYTTAFGSIQLIKHATAGWIPFGGGVGGGEGGSGIGLPEGELVHGTSYTLKVGVPALLDLGKTFTTTGFNVHFERTMDYTAADWEYTLPNVTSLHLPEVYNVKADPTQSGDAVADPEAGHWKLPADPGRAILKHPTLKKWMLVRLDVAQEFFLQIDEEEYDHPARVQTWASVDAGTGERTILPNAEIKLTDLTLTLPLPPSGAVGDTVAFYDIWKLASFANVILEVDGARSLDMDGRSFAIDVDGASAEIQAVQQRGWVAVRWNVGADPMNDEAPHSNLVVGSISHDSTDDYTSSNGSIEPTTEGSDVKVMNITEATTIQPPLLKSGPVTWLTYKIVQGNTAYPVEFTSDYVIVDGVEASKAPNSVTWARVLVSGDGKYDVWLSSRPL
ncbi:hypothetical protein [Vibrio phage vB_VmeM-Yong XC32]|nr:hypothetical protein [Vibrio phage vB_VmeM-Yong XC31]QAX96478.1 hypothetical protein [Vibrio phage vB_VmeM-Yong XC32]QAX96795.1 hypothetical protein [Vibrio phage vB_VmeM-Yong MS31]QAX97114.1 hypothetical protein [Vibrio phage vB_VmeM-Yong MS32]